MSDLSSEKRARAARKPPHVDLFDPATANTLHKPGSVRLERLASDDGVAELDLTDDELVPVREEIPGLPLYGTELEQMVDAAIARSAPPAPARSALRAPTIPPPLPFNPLRQPTLSGYPPLPPAEARPSYPDATHEESGRRQKITEPATVDHVRAAAHGTSAEISQLRDEIKQHITDEFTNLRRYAPLRPAFQAPPSRTNWLASIGRGAVEKVKGWWGSLTGGGTKNADRPKEEPGLGETIRLLEQAERDARDLPTMFLTGSLDRSALQTSKERWEGTVTNLQSRKPSATTNVERRRSSVIGERGLALQALLESDRRAPHGHVSPERGKDLQIIHDQLPKYIHTLNALRVSRDEQKKAAAEQALQGLKSVTGGVSINDFVARATLTCEAATRLPLADINDAAKKSLSNEYAQRLERMQKALGLRGELKESLFRIKTDLSRIAPNVAWKKTGTDR